VIELKDTHSNPAAIARPVARGVYDAPLVMNFLVPAIMSPAVFALTCSAAASEAVAMFKQNVRTEAADDKLHISSY
jgi:hypothetical protein